MSPESAPRLRFRGALVAGRWTRSQPSDIVEINGDTLRFSPWLRPNYELQRGDVEEVRVEKVRLPPFWWSTDIRFVLQHGGEAPKLFRPLRTRLFCSTLRERGWPVVP